MMSRIGLAFLTTAGFFYINIMPTIVSGLIESLGFSNQQAGNVASANMYGAALGALLAVFLVKRVPWRPVALGLLLLLVLADLSSIAISKPSVMTAARLLHGLVGGTLVGLGFGLIARTTDPDRTFGVLLFVQFSLGGLGIMFIPGLVPQFGTAALFLALVAFSLVTLALLPFLPDYPVAAAPATPGPIAETAFSATQPSRLVFTLALVAIFGFQAANMGLFAFIIELGGHLKLDREFVTLTLGISNWLGLVGAALVIAIGERGGYLRPLGAGILITTVAVWALLFSATPWIWVVANCAVGITWAFTIAYLLGLGSRFDRAGQAAAIAGLASKMGLASGPILAAHLLGETSNYPRVIWVSAIILACLLPLVWRPARFQEARPMLGSESSARVEGHDSGT